MRCHSFCIALLQKHAPAPHTAYVILYICNLSEVDKTKPLHTDITTMYRYNAFYKTLAVNRKKVADDLGGHPPHNIGVFVVQTLFACPPI